MHYLIWSATNSTLPWIHLKQKQQILINKQKRAGLKHCNDSKAFIEYSNDMNDIYEKTEKYNPIKNAKYWSYLMSAMIINMIWESCIYLLLINCLAILGQLLDISPKNFIFLRTFNSETSYIEVWFTDQNPKPLQIEDKTNITFCYSLNCKILKMTFYSVKPKGHISLKGYEFFLFLRI